MSTTLDVTEGIFAVLYVSIMGLTRFYKTTVFLHLLVHQCQTRLDNTIQYNTKTRMCANAQRNGRPAEHRWRPLFNAAKFG